MIFLINYRKIVSMESNTPSSIFKKGNQQANTANRSNMPQRLSDMGLGKLPPQALDLEEALLGALMLEKEPLANVIELLKPDTFYKEAHQKIFGIPVLKNEGSIESEINFLLEDKNRPYTLLHQFHQGGYAKTNPMMLDFMNRLWDAEKIPTDIVYTSKLLFGVEQLINENYFDKDISILVIHSGGLQGNRSLPEGTLKF